jgi:PTS system nitrogen regulatory IIA component
MKIANLIKAETVIMDLVATTKPELLAELAGRAAPLVRLDRATIFDALLERESFGSTGLGMGVAMPNARLRALRKPFALFAKLRKPIDFQALDGRPVDLIVLLLGPEPANTAYLDVLTAASRALRNATVRDQLRMCADAPSIAALLSEDAVGTSK